MGAWCRGGGLGARRWRLTLLANPRLYGSWLKWSGVLWGHWIWCALATVMASQGRSALTILAPQPRLLDRQG